MADYTLHGGVTKHKKTPSRKKSGGRGWLIFWLIVGLVLLGGSMMIARKHQLTGLQARIFYSCHARLHPTRPLHLRPCNVALPGSLWRKHFSRVDSALFPKQSRAQTELHSMVLWVLAKIDQSQLRKCPNGQEGLE